MPLINGQNGQIAMNVKKKKRESDAFKLDLIKFVEKHPTLYDTTLENYKSKSKEQLWLRFATQYEVDTAEVRREWNSLRTYYNSYIKRVLQHMSDPEWSNSKRKEWKFANDMCFLDPFLETSDQWTSTSRTSNRAKTTKGNVRFLFFF